MYQKMTHTLEDLKKLAAMELRDVNREELVDINQRKTTMIGHSTGRRITMKPLFPEKFLMQPIICGHPAIIQRKTDPCPC